MYKNFSSLILIFLSTFTFFQVRAVLADVPKANSTDPQIELDALRISIMDNFKNRDIDGLLNHAHPDVVITWQNGEVTKGKAEAAKYFHDKMTGPNSPLLDVTEDPKVDHRIFLNGSVLSFGNMNDVYTLKDFDKPISMNSRFTLYLEKLNNKFVIRAGHFSINAFENDILSQIQKKTVTYAIIGALFFLISGFFIGKKIS